MLAQARADELMAMPKVLEDKSVMSVPAPGRALERGLVSVDRREMFVLDVYRGKRDLITLRKCTYQERLRSEVVLVRLDIGKPHTNPDGQEIPGPHVHTYREGFDDRWAEPVPRDRFPALNDLESTLEHFLAYCNVQRVPAIQRGMF